MMFGFAREKEFAKNLVNRLTQDLPPALMESRRTVLSVNKITRLLEKTYVAAVAFQRERRTGFIRRAVLANAVRWELKERGYPHDFVDLAVEGLVVELTRAPKQAESSGKA